MLYFRGCTAREKQTSIAEATEKLLNLAGVDYHILKDEACCGSVLLRTGFLKEAQEQIAKNSEAFKDETVLTSCAGCYKTLKEDYENIDVIHISQLLNNLISEGKLNFSKNDFKVTYHDSCHLGRHMEIFDDPRSVIESVADLVEMENNRENSLCCGAGGGVKSAYPEIADEMAKSRIGQAKDTECEILITACPFCKLNLENDEMEVLDLTEFLVKYGGLDEEE
ncbi:MAG: (Fe-S)-binding protein [Methanobrevibacter thaueri]|jgi:Fe-S oxidoreductase|uniref:(Fe-S)-binding protein n=1 Tax=Methanobrevibacter thaueri TaxID=190975 RepID=UPI0026F08383|nr:heterodisulfide reductase-related iron-sulfur binding cluster [Methanobrevibacter thaueri]MBE6495853.1 (Fe-S)-binding protein [Methanobrevibacter thaueri]